ncbi:hypothetical protein OPV22_007478 [Ensete ventricosum]|uniref:Uncharacterized protein n=1 Tax=Ensete ventricosum TaxID=4639 RepID=A0AAV8Q787_ENSVE|nr:hypothetical protein OPV22_007478 [Ensete ventricosum]
MPDQESTACCAAPVAPAGGFFFFGLRDSCPPFFKLQPSCHFSPIGSSEQQHGRWLPFSAMNVVSIMAGTIFCSFHVSPGRCHTKAELLKIVEMLRRTELNCAQIRRVAAGGNNALLGEPKPPFVQGSSNYGCR